MAKLSEVLAEDRFVVTCEFTPPKGVDLSPLRDKAALLAGLVDAVNLTDSHRARMSMSPLGAAKTLLDLGVAPIVQVTGRDRNRIAIQADLLAAASLGVENVLCMSGDNPAGGDHPDAKGVFDLEALGLLRTVCTLNEGKDLGGSELAGTPDLCPGAVANPGVEDILTETMVRKMEETDDGLRVTFEGGGATEDTFDRALVSVGRKPNTSGVGLEAAGVAVGDRGFIEVDGQRRTSAPTIFAVGDVTGEPMLAHKATHEVAPGSAWRW